MLRSIRRSLFWVKIYFSIKENNNNSNNNIRVFFSTGNSLPRPYGLLKITGNILYTRIAAQRCIKKGKKKKYELVFENEILNGLFRIT